MESSAIYRISIKDNDFSGALEKKGERWFAILNASAKRQEVQSLKAIGFLNELLNLEYEMEVQDSRAPKDVSIVDIKISDKDSGELANVSFFMEAKPQIPVKTADGKTYLARRPDVEKIIQSFKNIFEKEK